MENIKISDKFKDLIDEKYRNNYIFHTTTQSSDIFYKYFYLGKYDKEDILKELELETEPLAILFLNLIKFEIGEKKEKYNNSKICLEQLKEQEEFFNKIVFNICIYSKLIDILKEIKNIRKGDTNFLDNFVFSIYNTIKVFDNHNLIIKVLNFLGKGNKNGIDIINTQRKKITNITRITFYDSLLELKEFKILDESLYQEILVEYIEKLIDFCQNKKEVENSLTYLNFLNIGMKKLNNIKNSNIRNSLKEKTKSLSEQLVEASKICNNVIEYIDNEKIKIIKDNYKYISNEKSLEKNIKNLEILLLEELNSLPNINKNPSILKKLAKPLYLDENRVIANKEDENKDAYDVITCIFFYLLILFYENPIFNSCETKKLIYILKNEEIKGFLDEIIENYFCGNYFTCCSAISPTIERLIRNTYFKLGKSDIELYGKDNSLQKRKNLENLLKDNDIKKIYSEEFINYFSWLFNNDISYYNYRNSVCHGYKNYEEYNKIETTLQLFILILFLKKFYEYFDKIEESKKE
ncbi:DUF4209 domain-containing protein [Fusobacterium periodonticum]|uniref:DUF4209 domain-containing protein n=2 Tax=Fusobacterium periodonticum TaxID=860 RepID=A0AAD0MS06_9FUSO|nr:DUF4209 domain-containing protein [Fusobacterium periodonticum]AVQ24935.1 DUF4209 domain-containing protein [Fusobacterium periodonticum]KGE63324.1 hypothetical protein FSAG_003083 [Fusobacterium periodonticum 2_1_31]